MRHLKTLRRRTLAASLLLAVLIGIAFVALILTIRDARAGAEDAARSERVAAAATKLERQLLDLETGQRAYVITGQRSFLEPWDSALRAYPATVAELRDLVRDQVQRARVDRIELEIDSYVEEWSQHVIDAVLISREQAARFVATGEGKSRVDHLRRLFDAFLARQRQLTDERSERADAGARRAIVLGLGGLAGSTALILLFAAYLVRSTIRPIEDVAAAARRLREGDGGARAHERAGADEAATLTRDFNAMATALQQNHEELAQQFAELRAVLDSTDDGITMTAADGSLILSNKRMEQLWQELGVDVRGGIWERLAALARRSGSFEEHAPAFMRLAEDDEFVYESPFEVPELGRSFAGYTAPVRGAEGVVIGRLFRLRETTTEQAAERAKEEFLATVSHELRTPLTSIIGYLELVRDGEVGEVTPDQDRFLGIVDRSARHLHGLVDDLLFVGRAGEGRIDLDLSAVDFADVVSECAESFAAAVGEKDIELALDVEPGLDVTGDRRRLTQLVTNLLGNAIKFTPAGGRVQVRASAENGAAVLEVTDTGIGISAQDQERLFERFFRAATAKGAQVPGTGLGLAISRAIADSHGGSIGVRSSVGEGATFRVELPMEVSE